ncbi:hypothetical protein GOC91_23250 [Sinorhizobium medicae]|uniref:Uncharacterized protein n=2 Tax=Sinorhizobium medicae TaxID=110321 RepID=A0A508WUT4_9HYPH|nr:hypothetical protein [Sinorhizobium medicae]ABR60667.1 hypothetical protein Smed_1832 [Sinorhizobium medicae WSM419]MBO1944007.1 hypothetical protein [Sinorhizobium medicae]MBO1965015.1 hypothetical protein [Sinorhizobium medicae]MDX0406484.1 hypothetical protein [Sinorhizobium medicae]MDX0413035.1 hypothetical protein [Sinorhizobium medicae]
MKPEERIAAAQALLDMPLFHLLMGELETAAVNACVNARHTDHETRAAFAAEVRAIRNFKGKIKFLAEEQSSACGKGAPA